nr:immunoglobulin heavy chain junction region [Macaca mulatta]MOY24399.1 immunoglobulin heavy chain junction region [Macaca mulatta]MOY24516.1 immunoglobulin heavy chain junction region [Macaca mulatta]MOY24845.1 immunoglobulin heavy chain junction region [Macaca mulatta]MOY25444.1 immunoglobulin heavy chain junction region [Macaca mulatta]
CAREVGDIAGTVFFDFW